MFFAQKVATCIMECLPVFSRTWLTSRLTAESETPSDEEISLREQPSASSPAVCSSRCVSPNFFWKVSRVMVGLSSKYPLACGEFLPPHVGRFFRLAKKKKVVSARRHCG